MKIIADINKVELRDFEPLISGAYRDKTIDVELSPEYDGLSVWAIFDRQSVKVEGGKCYTPTLERGTCSIGIYAVRLNNEKEIDLRYSPAPALINIEQGSYNSSLNSATTPTESEVERIYALIDEAIKAGMLKGEKGEQGIRGLPGVNGKNGADGKNATINGKNAVNILAGENISLHESGENIKISASCVMKPLALSTNANAPTLLTDTGAGAYIATNTGYIATSGGFKKLIGTGSELIIVKMGNPAQLYASVQTGFSIIAFWNTMTATEKNAIFINSTHVGNGLKFADGKLQLDIPVATANTTYGGGA